MRPEALQRLLRVIGPRTNWTRWAASFGVALALGAATARWAAAQPGRDRRAAETFADSIASATDREALRVLERDFMLRAKRDRSNPGLHYRLGYLALKQDELSDAAAEFKWATQLDSQWAAAWFGLARAELALGEIADTTKLGRRALLARDAWSRATTAFARSVAIDSAFALKIEAVATDRAGAASAAVARDGLRWAVTSATRSRSAPPTLALGRVERLLGDTAAALAAFDLASSLPGGRGPGLLEAARTRLTRGGVGAGGSPPEPVGIENYFAAAAVDDTASVALLRAELSWIATADELIRFDAASGEERARMLRTLWTSRDRADLRQNGERLREHFRRLFAARRLYLNQDDQRVAVLVRHGEPDNRAAARPRGVNPNESWRYRRPEGDLIVHFVAGADTTNYRVVESVFDVLGVGEEGTAGDERPAPPTDLVDALIRSRAQLSPFYQAAAAGRRDQLGTFRAREREIGRASRNLALTTDRFPLRFDRDLAARVQIMSGARAGSGQLELAFAIPGFVFDSTLAAPARYSTRVRLAVWDSATQQARALDTVLMTELAKPVTPEGAVTGVVPLPLPPGLYSVRVVLQAADSRGMIASRDGVRIGWDGAAGEWMLSDLALGVPGRGAVLAPDRPIDPAAIFQRSDTILASAVLFGAGPSGSLRVKALLRPVSSSGKEEKWRGFPGREGWLPAGPDGTTTIGLWLPLRSVKPGRYELEVVVGGERVGEVRQQTRLEVTGSGR